jgi:hypothetical protein
MDGGGKYLALGGAKIVPVDGELPRAVAIIAFENLDKAQAVLTSARRLAMLGLLAENTQTSEPLSATIAISAGESNALYFHDFIKTPCAPSENSAAQM